MVIVDKGVGEEFWARVLHGPFEEKFSEKMECSYVGIYRNGMREEWGKMVSLS